MSQKMRNKDAQDAGEEWLDIHQARPTSQQWVELRRLVGQRA